MLAAETAIGWGRKKTDWFLDAVDTLQPLLDQKNAAYSRFLQAKQCGNEDRVPETSKGRKACCGCCLGGMDL